MLTFVPSHEITVKHLELLAASMLQAPAFERLEANVLINRVFEGDSMLFEFEGGLLLIELRQGTDGSTRLSILAFAGFKAGMKLAGLAADLRKIAAEWRCDAIETLCYDLRLARAIERIGGRLESVSLTLSVEG